MSEIICVTSFLSKDPFEVLPFISKIIEFNDSTFFVVLNESLTRYTAMLVPFIISYAKISNLHSIIAAILHLVVEVNFTLFHPVPLILPVISKSD